MDTNAGRFVEEQNAGPWMKRIAVGQVVKLDGLECRVKAIGPDPREITLELLGTQDREPFGTLETFDDARNEQSSRARDRDSAKHGHDFIGGGQKGGS